MSDYKPGDPVRVAFDARVVRRMNDGTFDVVGTTDLAVFGYVRPDQMERLPDLEPEWRPGDVVRAADGGTYARETHACRGDVWFRLGLDYAADPITWDKDVPRPLTPLVRDGKPWGDQ